MATWVSRAKRKKEKERKGNTDDETHEGIKEMNVLKNRRGGKNEKDEANKSPAGPAGIFHSRSRERKRHAVEGRRMSEAANKEEKKEDVIGASVCGARGIKASRRGRG